MKNLIFFLFVVFAVVAFLVSLIVVCVFGDTMPDVQRQFILFCGCAVFGCGAVVANTLVRESK